MSLLVTWQVTGQPGLHEALLQTKVISIRTIKSMSVGCILWKQIFKQVFSNHIISLFNNFKENDKRVGSKLWTGL